MPSIIEWVMDGWVGGWMDNWTEGGWTDGWGKAKYLVPKFHLFNIFNISLNFWKHSSNFTPLYCHHYIIHKSYTLNLKWWIIQSNLPICERTFSNIPVRELISLCLNISKNPLCQGIFPFLKSNLLWNAFKFTKKKKLWYNTRNYHFPLCLSLHLPDYSYFTTYVWSINIINIYLSIYHLSFICV